MVNPSAFVTNGALVTNDNPLPVSGVTPVVSGLTERTLNPRDLVANGAVVSSTNPLPVTFVQTVVQAWYEAVVTNGGTVSAARLAIVNDFVLAERAAGNWDLTDDYWALWAENAGQALTSLKQRRLATLTAAPTFTADRGYTFNGTTQFMDTGFIPGTHGVAMTISNCRIAVYERTDVQTNTFSMGCQPVAGSQAFNVRPRIGAPGVITIAVDCFGFSNATGAANTSAGFTVGSRNGLTTRDVAMYKNGAGLGITTAPSSMGIALSTVSVYIGANNANGVLNGPRASSNGFGCVGASLTAAQEALQYANVQAWGAAVGASV